jgi:hypothetical protein
METTMTPEAAAALKQHTEALRPKRQIASDVHKDWMIDTRPRWNGKVVEPASQQHGK